MQTEQRDELTRRFGAEIADTISRIYDDAVESASGKEGSNMLSSETRRAVVQGLLDEAGAGRTDEGHLRDVASIFFPPR